MVPPAHVEEPAAPLRLELCSALVPFSSLLNTLKPFGLPDFAYRT